MSKSLVRDLWYSQGMVAGVTGVIAQPIKGERFSESGSDVRVHTNV